MTTLYVINLLSNAKGFNTVHKYGCIDFPDNFYELGLYDSCKMAVHTAKAILPNARCCPSCISGCNDPDHLENHEEQKKNVLSMDIE